MLFTEPTFLFLFLPVLLFLHALTPRRGRNLLLVLFSVVFYAAGEWRFVLWLLGAVVVTYWVAIALQRTRGTRWAKATLAAGLAADLGLLATFKYTNFFVSSLNGLLAAGDVPLVRIAHIALPLGISFFTFHKISYEVDIYRGVAEARRNPVDLALYILFFPQLIAGPIIRYHEIAEQISKRHANLGRVAQGVRRFTIGLGKKMILANTVALTADRIFAIPAGQLTVATAWLGIACYTLQIYLDFSGYSDMAIGLGRMFGFRFPENFNYPYISASITEFWRRWHMSLSRWFRDYLYIPLGGNRRGTARTYANLVTVFFLCGLWHGAAWTFVIWGLFHGFFLVFERVGFGRWLARQWAPLKHGYALLVVMVGWVFFRSPDFAHALAYLRAMAGLGQPAANAYSAAWFLDNRMWLALAAGIVGCTPFWPALMRRLRRFRLRLAPAPGLTFDAGMAVAADVGFAAILLLSYMLIAAGTYNPFIYFRF
jgi:alginate O-acetyltransferase complex protein AlgI